MPSKGGTMLVVFFVMVLFTSGLCHAQEGFGVEVIKAKAGAESLMPEIDSCEEEKPMTLEEMKALFGAKRVCGVPCGWGPPYVNCTNVCGDFAQCYNYYCLYS